MQLLRRHGSLLCTLTATVAPALATAQGADAALSMDNPDAVTVELTQSAALPLALPALAALSSSNQVPGFQATMQTTQTMLWARYQALAAGVGVEQRWQPHDAVLTGPPREAALLMGISLDTSQQSTLVWQAPLQRGASFGQVPPERQMRLGLTFRKRDPYSDLKRGALMKVELSGASVLSVRPRGGRWSMTLSSKW